MTNEVIREAALEWISSNTTFDVSTEPLPASVEMFIEKYSQVMELRPGVSSESISGLSQSFSGDISSLLKQYASELIGEEYMVSEVRFVQAVDRYK